MSQGAPSAKRQRLERRVLPNNSTTSIDSREINILNALDQWPLLNIAIENDVLVVQPRSPADILAEAANNYTLGFAKTHSKFWPCLVESIVNNKHVYATIKYLIVVLEEEANFVGYILITLLLAVTSNSLIKTTVHFLELCSRRKNKNFKVKPVQHNYRTEAREILGHHATNDDKSVRTSLKESVLSSYLYDLSLSQDQTLTKWMRQASNFIRDVEGTQTVVGTMETQIINTRVALQCRSDMPNSQCNQFMTGSQFVT